MPNNLEIQGLQEQQALITQLLNTLKRSRIIETDAAQQFKLDHQIAEKEKELTNIKNKIANLQALATTSTTPIASTTNKTTMITPIPIFLSYAHEDEAYKDELLKHLKPLERNQQITLWQDGKIIAGQQWDDTIRQHLSTARIILFLISADFMHSDYIDRVEVKEAIANHAAGKQILIPIIIRACDFSSLLQLSKFQALPKHAKPIKSWADQDEAWLDVVKGINRVLESMKS